MGSVLRRRRIGDIGNCTVKPKLGIGAQTAIGSPFSGSSPENRPEGNLITQSLGRSIRRTSSCPCCVHKRTMHVTAELEERIYIPSIYPTTGSFANKPRDSRCKDLAFFVFETPCVADEQKPPIFRTLLVEVYRLQKDLSARGNPRYLKRSKSMRRSTLQCANSNQIT